MTEQRRKTSLEEALDAIPVFPLPHVVLFPDAALPLHIFEPRYRTMLEHCLEAHGAIAVAQLLPGEDEHGRPKFADVSGGGVILEHVLLEDGRSNIVVLGRARLRLEEIEENDPERYPYRRARATILADHDVSVADSDRAALVAAATMFAAEVKKHDHLFSFRPPEGTNAGQVADVCAYQLVVDVGVRQAILEELDPRARVRMVIRQLALQHSAMLKEDGGALLN